MKWDGEWNSPLRDEMGRRVEITAPGGGTERRVVLAVWTWGRSLLLHRRHLFLVFAPRRFDVIAVVVGVLGAERGDVAQPLDDAGQVLEQVIDVFVGVVDTEAEPDGTAGAHGDDTHGAEDVGGVEGTSGAGGTGTGADADLIEEHEDGFGLDEVEGDVGGVGETGFASAVADGVGDVGEDPGFETVAQGPDAGVLVFEGGHGEFGGTSEGDDVGDAFGSATATTFLMTADDVGGVTGAAFHV